MHGSLRTVARDLGRMLQALAGMTLVSVPVALVWGEFFAVPALLAAGALPLAVGTLLARRFADAEEPSKLHGMVVAAAGWFCVAVFGAVPFLLVAWTVALDPPWLAVPAGTETLAAFRTPVNALFESMSGFTGTGLTMTARESVLPRTLQWWRTFTEWVGGVGVIVLTTAILARPGSGSLTLYESEARSEKIHPSIVSTVRTIWWIFLLFTVVAIVLLWLAGMPLWHAINHGMTGLATGGFSVTDASIAAYDSPLVDLALLPVMVLGSIAFPVHYLILQGDLRNLYTDLQTRWVFGYFGLGTLAVWLFLLSNGTYAGASPETVFGVTVSAEPVRVFGVAVLDSGLEAFEALRYGAFQFVAAASCTGFQTAGDLGTAWRAESKLAVSVAMVIGGAAGSTAGGIKLVRALTLSKGTAYRIGNVFYPDSAIRLFELDDRTLSDEEAAREFEEAAIVGFLWTVFLGVGVFVFLLTVDEHSLANVLFEVASAQGNVGLSTGITGPEMPLAAKVMTLFNMWIGRLEIIPVLVLLRGLFKGVGLYR